MQQGLQPHHTLEWWQICSMSDLTKSVRVIMGRRLIRWRKLWAKKFKTAIKWPQLVQAVKVPQWSRSLRSLGQHRAWSQHQTSQLQTDTRTNKQAKIWINLQPLLTWVAFLTPRDTLKWCNRPSIKKILVDSTLWLCQTIRPACLRTICCRASSSWPKPMCEQAVTTRPWDRLRMLQASPTTTTNQAPPRPPNPAWTLMKKEAASWSWLKAVLRRKSRAGLALKITSKRHWLSRVWQMAAIQCTRLKTSQISTSCLKSSNYSRLHRSIRLDKMDKAPIRNSIRKNHLSKEMVKILGYLNWKWTSSCKEPILTRNQVPWILSGATLIVVT